jgi:uncharacterized protein with HEPN domain
MPRDVKKICFDILQAVKEIEEFTLDKKFSDYCVNRMLQKAVEREFEIIGEGLKRLRDNFEDQFLKVADRRKILDFRNILAHGYDSISEEIVWSIIENNLDILKREIQDIFDQANE